MTQSIRIMFVDDEANILNALQRVFIEEDYEILTATSGAEAIETLNAVGPVQVVVSDYRMPQMNGVEFLRQVRSLWPETVRVVLSGYADTAAIVSAINDGQVYRFIPKPWDEDDLRMTIAAAVEQHRRQKKEIVFAEALQKRIEELERENSFLIRMASKEQPYVNAQAILDSLPAGVLALDLAGKVLLWNPAAGLLLGTGSAELRNAPSLPAESGDFKDLIEAAAKGKRGYSKMTIDGETYHVTALLTDQAGGDPLVLAVLCREEPDV